MLLSGWASHAAMQKMGDGEFCARFGHTDIRGFGMTSFYAREGLEEIGLGILLYVECDARPEGAFASACASAAPLLQLTPTQETRELDPAAMARMLAPLLPGARPPLPEDLRRMLLPPMDNETPPSVAVMPPAAAVALGAMVETVLMSIDTAIFCPPAGVVLIGWCLSRLPASLALRSGATLTPIDLAAAIRLPRPGVIDEVGRAHGFEDPRCGFIAHVPQGFDRGARSTVEITAGDETGFVEVPRPLLHGMPAIRHLLADCDLQYADVAPAFAQVLGPAIGALNAHRLGARGGTAVVQYGAPPAAPTASVVIPLYGRIDYAEVQCALFAADPALAGCEIIYVLDDPQQRRAAENLFAAIHARFAQPLTLLVHDHNLGFAPACNTGLAAARGRQVCFLNSDVFPTGPGWLQALGARLDADPSWGVVGPVLRHEDGSVQHAGMDFERLPQHGNWWFSRHAHLASRAPVDAGMRRWPAITGACMVLDTARARALGGFDEAYVIGDFEDSDLCLRLARQDLASGVDGDVTMVHFGRRSQPSADARWRMNLILANAWLHHTRWHADIAALQEGLQ